MRQRGDYGEQPERAPRFTVKVRCLHCKQVVDAVPERSGDKMWQHRLESGEDCPAWKLGTDHEPVDALERRERLERERLERERAAFVPRPLEPNTFPSYRESREQSDIDAADACARRALDEYSGDYTDRRAGGSRC